MQKGIEVTVLNFSTVDDYELDAVSVISLSSFKNKYNNINKFDLLISHAPNIRMHYRFIRKYADNVTPIVFFFHGHEIMHINKQYPKPYSYMKSDKTLKRTIQHHYDNFKIATWRRFFKSYKGKTHLVFVSQWMKKQFEDNLNIDADKENLRTHIIYNTIGSEWMKGRYDISNDIEYDFISIRSNLDESKYCTDLIIKWAKRNPEQKFLLIGKGSIFNHIEQPENVHHISGTFNHKKLKEFVDSAKIALMPTRLDAQGVMSCELSSYGIPLISSDIDVSQEIFADFPNVRLISNDSDGSELANLKEDLLANYSDEINTRYFPENTIQKEIDLFEDITRNGK